MNTFDVRELAVAAGGRIVRLGETVAHGISTDSRTLEKGCLFVAIIGECFDGHRFADHALRKGATAVLVSKLDWDDSEREFGKDRTIILVDDTVKALGAMAGWWRRKCGWKVIGVTGSCGKTSTKELLRLTLSARWDTGGTQGNLNNEIGLPVSILAAPPDLDVFVAEMGMNHPGEIDRLSAIAGLDAGVLTSIAPVHLEYLESLENIAAAKAEMIRNISEGGALVWDVGDPFASEIGRMGVEGGELLGIPVASGISFPDLFAGLYRAIGRGGPSGGGKDRPRANALFRAENVSLDSEGHSSYTLVCESTGERFQVVVPAFGTVNVLNSLLAIAAATAMGVEPAAAAGAVRKFRNVGSRMKSTILPMGAKLLDDSYNSNPLSFHMAVMDLVGLPCMGRRFLVAGDMLELGEKGQNLHEVSLDYALSSGIDGIYAVGPLMAGAAGGFGGNRIRIFDDPSVAGTSLASEIGPDDIVLVKGSRGMRLEGTVVALNSSEPDLVSARARAH